MTNTPNEPPAAPLDLQKYSRPELAEHIHGVLAVGRDVARTGSVVFGGIVFVWVVGSVFFLNTNWLLWIGVLVCGTLVSFELLTAVSAWRLLSRKLWHAIEASELMVQICLDALIDIDAIAAGRATPPSPAALVRGVFDTVVKPIVEVQAGQSLIGRLLGWLYTRYTTSVVRTVINTIPDAHEPLTLSAVDGQREHIEAAASVLEQVRDSGLRGIRHFRRHILPAFAIAALSGAMLQAIPLAITTGLLAIDGRAPFLSGSLSSPNPLLDPATNEPACAVLIEARYDHPDGRTKENGSPVRQHETRLYVAESSAFTVESTSEVLQISGGPEQPWASNHLVVAFAVPEGRVPDYLPSDLSEQTNLSLRSNALACGETHTLFGATSGAELTLQTAPPLPIMRVTGGLFLLYLFHQFGFFPVLLALFYAAFHIAYLVLVAKYGRPDWTPSHASSD